MKPINSIFFVLLSVAFVLFLLYYFIIIDNMSLILTYHTLSRSIIPPHCCRMQKELFIWIWYFYFNRLDWFIIGYSCWNWIENNKNINYRKSMNGRGDSWKKTIEKEYLVGVFWHTVAQHILLDFGISLKRRLEDRLPPQAFHYLQKQITDNFSNIINLFSNHS